MPTQELPYQTFQRLTGKQWSPTTRAEAYSQYGIPAPAGSAEGNLALQKAMLAGTAPTAPAPTAPVAAPIAPVVAPTPEKPFIADSEEIVKEEKTVEQQVKDAMAGTDNEALKKSYEDIQKNIDDTVAALEKRRAEETKLINEQFDILATQQVEGQKKETGAKVSTLARIGGFLGQSASSQGALLNLSQSHRQEQTVLETKRASALQEANNAINDKQFNLARQKVTEVKNLNTAIETRRNKFFDQTMSIITETRQQAEEDRAQKKDIYDDAIKNIEAVMPDYTDQLEGKTRAEVEDFMFTKAKELRVDPNLLIGKYYAALQKEKAAPKTLGTPDTGVWEYNEKTGEWLNVILARKPISSMTATERLTAAKSVAIGVAMPIINASIGRDGKVDPKVYQELRDEFAIEFGDTSAFDEVFSGKLSAKEKLNLGLKVSGEEIKTAPQEKITADEAKSIIQGQILHGEIDIAKSLQNMYSDEKLLELAGPTWWNLDATDIERFLDSEDAQNLYIELEIERGRSKGMIID